MADEESNDFRSWMKSMGYNAKQVSVAGEVLGMSPSLAGHSSRGLRELTKTERLAMAAATTGIPEWSPANEPELMAVRMLYTILTDEIQRVAVGSDPEMEALRAIRAVIRSEAYRLATESRLEPSPDPETDKAILDVLRAAMRGTSGH
ncbi:hypothetical protein Rleg9DRAFT_1731 [Rhizobium leguminosarum bv. trifolii WSM597]|uniref:Uncharacterized protein n=1 Tax=Rhizobium leguminosarum bv. trifolii WSM597 TaxID=754764 RepID=I9X2I1_RHILT|nr:hypothetical protein Rleg9DRAFT_1731 [Rhizobium leguminosarum bv. trifolii WSM597]